MRMTRLAGPRERRRAWLIALYTAVAILATACGATNADDASEEEKAATESSSDSGTDTSTSINDDGATSDEETPEATATTTSTAPEAALMPAMIGLTEAEAQAELVALGLDEPAITTQESFEPAGTVLEQLPRAGTRVTGTIGLVVAESIPPLPDFVGLPIADVRAWAEPRGIEIREETELVTEPEAGIVLGQVPPAGAEASQEFIVTLAESPVTLELAKLEWVDRACFDISDIEMNGTLYPDSVVFRTSRACRSGSIDYNLSRDWKTLEFILGLDDRRDADMVTLVEISADDETIYSNTVVFGDTTEVRLDVTDVLRLKVTVSLLSGDSTRLGLANARLIGGAAASSGG